MHWPANTVIAGVLRFSTTCHRGIRLLWARAEDKDLVAVPEGSLARPPAAGRRTPRTAAQGGIDWLERRPRWSGRRSIAATAVTCRRVLIRN